MKRLVLGLVLLVLLSGCSDGGGGVDDRAVALASPTTGPSPPVNVTSTPLLPVTLELAGCTQLHTSFPYPIAVFSQLGFQLPPGFSFASANGQTVDAFLSWWFCPEGRLNRSVNQPFPEVGSMFASLPVVPPSDLAGLDTRATPVALDLVPLTWILSSQLASNHLGRIDGLRGGYVETGDVHLVSHFNAEAGEMFSAQAPASFGVFDVDVAIQVATAERPEGRYRMWLWEGEGDVTSYLDIHNGPGSFLGAGTADLRFAGDPEAGAPPLTAGTSQVVDATNVVVELVQLK